VNELLKKYTSHLVDGQSSSSSQEVLSVCFFLIMLAVDEEKFLLIGNLAGN